MEYYLISIIIRRFKIYIEHLVNYKFLIEIEITLFKIYLLKCCKKNKKWR